MVYKGEFHEIHKRCLKSKKKMIQTLSFKADKGMLACTGTLCSSLIVDAEALQWSFSWKYNYKLPPQLVP